MRSNRLHRVWPVILIVAFALLAGGVMVACTALTTAGSGPRASPSTSVGPTPGLPAPAKAKLVPTVKIAKAEGWPAGVGNVVWRVSAD